MVRAGANSLFEDNAEYGLGMFLGVKQSRERVEDMVKAMLEGELPEDLKAALTDWWSMSTTAKAPVSVPKR